MWNWPLIMFNAYIKTHNIHQIYYSNSVVFKVVYSSTFPPLKRHDVCSINLSLYKYFLKHTHTVSSWDKLRQTQRAPDHVSVWVCWWVCVGVDVPAAEASQCSQRSVNNTAWNLIEEGQERHHVCPCCPHLHKTKIDSWMQHKFHNKSIVRHLLDLWIKKKICGSEVQCRDSLCHEASEYEECVKAEVSTIKICFST